MNYTRIVRDARSPGGASNPARARATSRANGIPASVSGLKRVPSPPAMITTGDVRPLTTLDPEELMNAAKELRAPIELVREVAETGALPVVNFAAGGIATPSDAALMMQLGYGR